MEKCISNSLRLINFNFSNDAKKIVIKPNMCYYWDYSTGQTTDPKFVGALIKVIRNNIVNADISIVESDASAMKCKYAFKILGYERLAKAYNVRLVNLTEDRFANVEVQSGNKSFRFMVPQTISQADLRINVPKIKYMDRSDIKLTCALKNLYGCNPYPRKFRFHPFLCETIVALNKALKFDLSIIDGNVVSGGQPRKLNLVMASTDSVAVDAAAAKIAGVNPKSIRYLQLASKEGLGSTSFESTGLPISYFKARYPRVGSYKKLMGKAVSVAITLGLGKKLGIG